MTMDSSARIRRLTWLFRGSLVLLGVAIVLVALRPRSLGPWLTLATAIFNAIVFRELLKSSRPG